jgi:hypothetical protein
VVYGNTILFERHVGVAMLIIFFTSGALVSQKVFYELKVDFMLRNYPMRDGMTPLYPILARQGLATPSMSLKTKMAMN